jgi:hypothetical protein
MASLIDEEGAAKRSEDEMTLEGGGGFGSQEKFIIDFVQLLNDPKSQVRQLALEASVLIATGTGSAYGLKNISKAYRLEMFQRHLTPIMFNKLYERMMIG